MKSSLKGWKRSDVSPDHNQHVIFQLLRVSQRKQMVAERLIEEEDCSSYLCLQVGKQKQRRPCSCGAFCSSCSGVCDWNIRLEMKTSITILR